MTDFRQLTDTVSVAPQITLDDVVKAADAGFTSIVCNRPDGEEPGQLPLDQIKAAVADAGLAFHHIPIVSGQLTREAVAQSKAALFDSGDKVLAYCRSGTRSCTLWGLAAAAADHLNNNEISAAAASQGYDLAPLTGLMDQLRGGEV